MNTNTMQSPAPDTFPKWVLWCAGGLIAFSLIAVGLVRITGNGPDQLTAAITAERSLRFEDRTDGAVYVIDGSTGQLLTVMRGEQGFLRGTVRALARDRRARQIGPEMPFDLVARTGGRLALHDPLTGHRIDLESFGPDNVTVFLQFLTMKPASGSN